ncbi:acyl-CoA N-acyltransferase [Sodiomyces alkalinus F11]|uniref:Acyl-CoA N-acyltransferase n=1 Tax=Sodiomyces alkalinus (strain CBS 110278 / VKM F-3762 / F11) TaxID=1314773 RepID=A0A3N2PR18_SODAK|nr:acyl-CoA N-acyltransferase [Sodiomyces alkalinus F11]ROT36928.1 acyl-CoA N-acyltransferase [Sodiomyces alkalinus F11]
MPTKTPPATCCPAAPTASAPVTATWTATWTATPAQTPTAQAPVATLRIEAGYRPGFIARTLQMHMDYYHSAVSWGQAFEAAKAQCWGKIVEQLPSYPDSQIWSAVRVTGDSERIVGTIMLDSATDAEAEAEAGEGRQKVRTVQLRGFIVDSDARGLGAGKKLLAAAMAHVEERGIEKVILHTMDSLGAAVYLYRAAGFVLHSEEERVLWGAKIKEQLYIWRRKALPAK